MRFAHTNIISTHWKELADFYVNTFDCKLVPPVRRQSGEWLDQGTGLQNAQLEGAHLLLPGHGIHGPTLEIYQYRFIEEHKAAKPNTKGFGKITEKEVQGVGKITFVYARDPEGNLIELQSWE